MKHFITALIILSVYFLVSCSQNEDRSGHDHSSHKHSAQDDSSGSPTAVLPQKNCPIKGGEIDKEVFTDYKGQRIYYCCPGCDKKFLENPDKYLSAMKSKGISPAKLQSQCPVSGDEIDGDIFANTKEGKIYVCCKKCKNKVEATPEKFINKMKMANIVIGTFYKNPSTSSDSHADHNH